MILVNDNNDHGHGPCCSDKYRHGSDLGMWHVIVINHEEYSYINVVITQLMLLR